LLAGIVQLPALANPPNNAPGLYRISSQTLNPRTTDATPNSGFDFVGWYDEIGGFQTSNRSLPHNVQRNWTFDYGTPNYGMCNMAVGEFGKRILDKYSDITPPETRENDGGIRYWEISFTGRFDENGKFLWKLRANLEMALKPPQPCNTPQKPATR